MSKIISYKDLEEILKGLEGKAAKFVRLHTRTIPAHTVKSRATGLSFAATFGCDEVYKLDERNVLINASYERVVNRRRKEEGLATDFKSEGTYGTLIGKCLLLTNSGSMQVRTYHVKTWRDNSKFVKPDGTEFSPEQLKDLKAHFLKLSDGGTKQGIVKTFKPLNFKMESIRSFKMDGAEYIVAGA